MNSPPPLLRPPLPSPPASHSDSSPFLYLLFLLIFIGIIVLIHAFFFAIKCPPNPFDRRRRRSVGAPTVPGMKTSNLDQVVSSVVYKEAECGQESGDGECPVCLTAFKYGEVIREVNVCKHLFHVACIDMWLYSHSNCPVCRAFIATKPAKPAKPAVVDSENDFRQGLPDSANLV